ncbi:thioesterase family protein [Actinomadura sp. HBU206391]|uniref:thioesterase family protein n=1 Tax=Actinomadura sp. HBU206391 TaxID=2731692 RepID=UPI0016506944|nr:thioesterase family protein [Actinomadura sp. HBU206391]MBC6456520.1 thioesterase family protein [Actinomadura sp. HBU206391]
MTAAHPFDADTEVTPAGDGRFAATLTERWTALTGAPNGGYVLAVCLRALRFAMPFPDPVVVSATFMRPAAPGPAEVRTELLRSGRRVATGEARLVQGDAEVVRAVASFSDLRLADGPTLILNRPPALPPPQDAVDPLGGGAIPGITIADRVEYRTVEKPGWLRGEPTGDPRSELWMRFKERRDTDLVALAMLVDAVSPAVMELGASGSATLQLTVHLRAHPAPGWLACRMATRHLIDGYHEEDFEIWDSDGALVAQSRQFALLR